MQCRETRLHLSARLDGEPMLRANVSGQSLSANEAGEVDEHVGGCLACRAWLTDAERVVRAVRGQAGAAPDLTARIVAALRSDGAWPGARNAARHPDRFHAGWRWALGLLAVVQLMLAVPDLLGAVGHDAHAGREVAAFDIALAVGLLVAACYPEHARVFAPVVMTLVVCFASISALDVIAGVVTPGRVAVHGIAVVQAGLLWLLARHAGARAAAA